MEYSKEFNDVVNQAKNENFYVGVGYPTSKILIIGKEAAIEESKDDFERKNLINYHNNAYDWQKNIEGKIEDSFDNWNIDKYMKNTYATNNPLHSFKGVSIKNHKEGQTWRKYQKLHDVIYKGDFDPSKDRAYDFQNDFFLTELNDSPNKNTSNAVKSGLEERKDMFENSYFFQQFPVVILACSDYIWNTEKDRQIDRVFGVKYVGDEKGKHIISKGNWFFTHSNSDNSKLVIHTRQLSMGVKNELILKMGLEIRGFLLKKGLLPIR